MTAGAGRYVLVGIELLPNAKTLGRTEDDTVSTRAPVDYKAAHVYEISLLSPPLSL